MQNYWHIGIIRVYNIRTCHIYLPLLLKIYIIIINLNRSKHKKIIGIKSNVYT